MNTTLHFSLPSLTQWKTAWKLLSLAKEVRDHSKRYLGGGRKMWKVEWGEREEEVNGGGGDVCLGLKMFVSCWEKLMSRSYFNKIF